MTFVSLLLQFAADFAQRWIVNWLEKRAANYKAKPLLNTPLSSLPSSPAVQEIRIEDASISADNGQEQETQQEKNTSTSRKNLTVQQQDPTCQPEIAKTPSIKRRQQPQQEGLVSSFRFYFHRWNVDDLNGTVPSHYLFTKSVIFCYPIVKIRIL